VPSLVADRGGQPLNRYPCSMTQSGHNASEDTTTMFAAVGITVTEEGKARARAKLAEADARRTPERQAALRAQVGLPPASTA
jgi:hypothetical protein